MTTRNPTYARRLLSFCAFLGLCIQLSNAAEEQNSERWHPARKLSMAVVREFILNAVTNDPELHRYVDLDELRDELPYTCDLYFVEGGPAAFAHPPLRPFAMLGRWKLVFGSDLRAPTEKDSRYFLRSVTLSREKHLSERVCEYTDIILKPAFGDRKTDWDDGNIQHIALESWRIEKYSLTDLGLEASGRGLACLAAGGDSKVRVGNNSEASITKFAFIGHVERMAIQGP